MRTPRRLMGSVIDRFVRWLDRIAEDGVLRMMGTRVRTWFGARIVSRKLVMGEVVIAQVRHSGILFVPPVLVGLLGVLLAIRWLPFVSAEAAFFAVAVVVGLLGFGFFRFMWVARDRFVVTDSRVFRVWGLFTLNEAEMEIVRLLDITVIRPWWLRPFGSGHMVLENAAQQQGIRDIRYVPQPEEIARLIHRRRRDMSGLGPNLGETKKKNPRRPDHPRIPGPVSARRR